MKISKLNNSDLPQVHKLAFEAWKDAYAGQSHHFIEKVSEFIVRKNYYDNEHTYKIVEDGVIKAILFGCEKNEKNDALKWVEHQRENFTGPELVIMNNQVDYLTKTDDLLSAYLTDNDIKLALIISNTRGYGTKILNHFIKDSQYKGKDKIYLWTDTTCNHEYYPLRGFEEILCLDNANDNKTEEAYQTLFYSKKI